MLEQIKKKLMSDLAYSPGAAERTAYDLCAIKDPDLRKGILEWLHKDIQTRITEDVYSTDILTEKYGMTYPASLIFLQWYKEDPQAAVSVLGIRM